MKSCASDLESSRSLLKDSNVTHEFDKVSEVSVEDKHHSPKREKHYILLLATVKICFYGTPIAAVASANERSL